VLARPSLPIVDFAQAAALLPASITFGAPIVFEHGDRGVLARLVVLDGPLLAIYNAVRAAEPQSRRAAEPQSRRAAAPPVDDAPYTDPGSWTPHVTLARRLRLASLDDAHALLGPERAGWAVWLRPWDSGTRTVTSLG